MPEAAAERRPPRLVMAFDFGLKYLGVAVGQCVTGTASPLQMVSARDGKPDWAAIVRLVQEWQPDLLLVGDPLNMDGSDSDFCARARRFARQLEGRLQLPVAMVDERLTSREARSLSADPAERHGIAAMLIAETWLASRTGG